MNSGLFDINMYLVEFLFRQGMLLLLSIQALTISYSRNKIANRFISLFSLLLFAILLVDKEFFDFIGFYDREVLRRLSWLPAFLIPSLFYFAVLYYVSPKRKLRYRDLLYSLPLMVIFILTLPFPLNYPYDEVGSWWRIYKDLYHIVSQATLILWSIYIWIKSYKLYVLHNKQIKSIYSFSEGVSIKWVRNLLYSSPLIITSHIMRVYFDSAVLYDLGDLLLLATVIYIAVNVVIQPEIFPSFRWDSSNESQDIVIEDESKEDLFDELEEKANELEELMRERRPYLNQDLTLGDLAYILNVRPQHLSQILAKRFQVNFYAYVNRYRVEYCKRLLLSESSSSLSMEGVALESGFRSKTTFYTRFKEFTGLTPKQYTEYKRLSDKM